MSLLKARSLRSCVRHVTPVAATFVRHSTTVECVAHKISEAREKLACFLKENAKEKVSDVTVDQVFGGMRDVVALVCETSQVHPHEGVRFRGLSVPEIQEKLPKAEGGEQPLPEAMFYLLCTGEVPSKEQVDEIRRDWGERAQGIPSHIVQLLEALPKELHPMSQLSIAVTALSKDSKFCEGYVNGADPQEYWKLFYEDAVELISKLPVIAGRIYRNVYHNGTPGCAEMSPELDWSTNFANQLGINDPKFVELLRLYLTIHSDHDGGNVSSHAVHLAGSALSNPFAAYAAGVNGLAGPLHGRVCQEVVEWLTQIQRKLGDDPQEEELKQYCEETLKDGKVIPGYGHPVLRVTDPRFTALAAFGQQHMPEDPLCKLACKVFRVAPPALQATCKVKCPWPNVFAHSGVLLHHFGLTEAEFYTVLFAASRALGILASLMWHRALMLPTERPRSISLSGLAELVEAQGGKAKVLASKDLSQGRKDEEEAHEKKQHEQWRRMKEAQLKNKREEEEMQRKEEEQRKKQEECRRMLEEEERKKLQEACKKLQEEEDRKRLQELFKKMKEEEEKRKLQQLCKKMREEEEKNNLQALCKKLKEEKEKKRMQELCRKLEEEVQKNSNEEHCKEESPKQTGEKKEQQPPMGEVLEGDLKANQQNLSQSMQKSEKDAAQS